MKDEIIQFLKENIIGKTLLTGAVYKLENGNLEGVYNDKMTFSNLVTTGNGFKFDMTTVTQELVYNLDDKGARTTIAKDYTGTSVFCYELAMRKSTKQITGYMRCVSTTVQDSTMYNPQIQISAESETKRSIFREKDKTKRSKKESAQHSKSRNKSFVMTSVSAL